ncbi:hypothetical protein AVEN_97718-1 [Araneus ventricosus]|uniref:Uncharacterized protein n=1 Tax=Araneus ventricosus TaxID=182803 RepID=A0A4Y2KK99_ARAVE|nr:hypothetical protein AVEN_97718-1 [Araneus ventricosus]
MQSSGLLRAPSAQPLLRPFGHVRTPEIAEESSALADRDEINHFYWVPRPLAGSSKAHTTPVEEALAMQTLILLVKDVIRTAQLAKLGSSTLSGKQTLYKTMLMCVSND